MKKLRPVVLLLGCLSLALSLWGQTQQYAYQLPLQVFTTVSTSGGFRISGTSAAFHVLTWNNAGTVSTCQIQVDSSVDGITWGSGDVIPSTLCTSNGTVTSASKIVNFIRINITAISGAGATVSARLTGYVTNPGGGGSGGTGSGASPIMGFYLSNQCPVANTGQCFNTPADTQVINSCTWTSGNPTVTCAAGTFASTDVGKTAFGYAGNCNPFQQQPLGGALTTTKTTIQTFTDSAHVNMAANASASAAGTGCLVFGHPDDSGFAAVSTAIGSLTTSPVCPKLYLAASQYMITTPPSALYAQPPGCLPTPGLGGGGSLGNMFFAAGYEVEGRGPAATILWLVPDFPETGACNHGNGSTSCFAVTLEGRWSQLQISGGSGAAGSNIPNGNTVLSVDVGSLDYVTLTNLADGAGGLQHICVSAVHWVQIQQVNISACGDINFSVASGAQVAAYRLAAEVANSINASSSNVLQQGDFSCYSCHFFNTQTAASALSSIVASAGATSITRLYQPHFSTTTGTNQFFYQAITANGPRLIIRDGKYEFTGTNGTGIFCNVTCTVDLQGVAMIGAGTKPPINITGTNSLLIDRGGNSYTGGTASTFPNVLNLDSQGTTFIAASNAVLSGGWGNTPTAAWSALTGGRSFTGTITNGTAGLAANPTITYTFPSAFPVVPNICQAIQIGGTNAIGTFAATALTATGVTFTFSLTPTASATEIVHVYCQ